MSKANRLSIDVIPEEHKRIKACAALHGVSIRQFILESVRMRLRQEAESKNLSLMTREPSQVLQELWDNEKDSAYDQL